jgi:hypothetical protein
VLRAAHARVLCELRVRAACALRVRCSCMCVRAACVERPSCARASCMSKARASCVCVQGGWASGKVGCGLVWVGHRRVFIIAAVGDHRLPRRLPRRLPLRSRQHLLELGTGPVRCPGMAWGVAFWGAGRMGQGVEAWCGWCTGEESSSLLSLGSAAASTARAVAALGRRANAERACRCGAVARYTA